MARGDGQGYFTRRCVVRGVLQAPKIAPFVVARLVVVGKPPYRQVPYWDRLVR